MKKKVLFGSAILSMGLVLAGCNGEEKNSVDRTEEKVVAQMKAEQAEKEAAEKKKQAEEKKEQAENLVKGKVVTFKNGKYIAGKDILAGKYVVSTESEMGGNFFVVREGETEPVVNEILGTKLDPPLMYNDLKLELKKEDKITIKSFDGTVIFTPVS